MHIAASLLLGMAMGITAGIAFLASGGSMNVAYAVTVVVYLMTFIGVASALGTILAAIASQTKMQKQETKSSTP